MSGGTPTETGRSVPSSVIRHRCMMNFVLLHFAANEPCGLLLICGLASTWSGIIEDKRYGLNCRLVEELMKNTIEELDRVLGLCHSKINQLNESEFSEKPSPHKWSKKEVLGHLIDSAHNNLRRFMCGQYEKTPPKINYDQDFWVQANDYQNMKKDDVISLWILMNQRVRVILSNMPAERYHFLCDTGKEKESIHSLQWLAEDYVKHMKHHLNQIFPGSFEVVYE